MSRNIPQVRKWLVNYWRDGKVIASDKIDAPTKFLAHLNLRFEGRYGPVDYDRRTLSLVRKS